MPAAQIVSVDRKRFPRYLLRYRKKTKAITLGEESMKKMNLLAVICTTALLLSACGREEQKPASSPTAPASGSSGSTNNVTSNTPSNHSDSPVTPSPVTSSASAEPQHVSPEESHDQNCYGAYVWTQSGVVSTWQFKHDGSASVTIDAGPGFGPQTQYYSKEQCDLMRKSALHFSADCSQLFLGGQTYSR